MYLCCPQVVSFFHRAILTIGLAVLSLWPMLAGLFGKAKVNISLILLLNHSLEIILTFLT